MVNLNKLNRDYKDILLGLSSEEITAYYKAMNKKLLECYPSSDSYKWNTEEYNKLFNSVEETTGILKTKYPLVNVINYITKYEELKSKYFNELDKVKESLLKAVIMDLSHVVNIIGFKLTYINYWLYSIHNYYNYRRHIRTGILETELNVPEELLEPLEPYFNNETATFYYGSNAESSINDFIEVLYNSIVKYIDIFNLYKDTLKPEDLPEEIASDYSKIYNTGLNYIDKFEELKTNPFKDSIEDTVKFKIDSFPDVYSMEEDFSRLLEVELAEAPSYDFETFELELPEGVVN